MIDRNTEPFFVVERRLRVYRHISSLPDLQVIPCVPLIQNKNRFHNKKNRHFLTRLAGDPIGKEADGETTIGDKNNVIKCIN